MIFIRMICVECCPLKVLFVLHAKNIPIIRSLAIRLINFTLSSSLMSSHNVLPLPDTQAFARSVSLTLIRFSGEQGSSSSRQQRR